jgi:membrane protein implicated in regulation of membrane protease activity
MSMRRPSVFVLLIAALLLLGVVMAVAAAVEGLVPLTLAGIGLALLAGVTYLADRRSQAARKALERRLDRGFEAIRQDTAGARQDAAAVRQDIEAARSELKELTARQDAVEVTERLDRLDARLDRAQRRMVTSAEAARLEVAEREHEARGAL